MGNFTGDYKKLFAQIEAEQSPLSEAWLLDRLGECAKNFQDLKQPIPQELVWEAIAFALYPILGDRDKPWGKHYGPMATWNLKDGGVQENPSRDSITPQAVNYWKARAETSKHPVMQARYADLVWEFGDPKALAGERPRMARLSANASIEASDKALQKHPLNRVHLLERAYSLALSLKDADLARKVVQALLRLHEALKNEDGAYFKAFAFEMLISKPCDYLEETERKKLEAELLQSIAAAVQEGSGFDPHAAVDYARLIFDFYAKSGNLEEGKRQIAKAAGALEKFGRAGNALLGVELLNEARELYAKAGLSSEQDRMLNEIREVSKKLPGELKRVESKVEISTKEMSDFVNELVGGNLEEAVQNIVIRFIPRIAENKEFMEKMAQETHFSSFVPRKLVDAFGLPVSQIGTYTEDVNGRLIEQISKDVQIGALFLKEALSGMIVKNNLTQDSLVMLLLRSPLFDEIDKPLLMAGMIAYFEKRYIEAAHVLIPRIETVIWKLAGQPIKSNGEGGFDRHTLGKMLSTLALEEFLGQDINLYLRVVLTDKKGLNWRNGICHGRIISEQINRAMVERLIHILLLFSLFKRAEADATGDRLSPVVDQN